MALSIVYFQIKHHWGRPHFVWDEYLYSELQKVEVGVSNCVVWDDDDDDDDDERVKVKPGAGAQPALLEKHQGGHQA